jgi:signal transduction histidine kinase
MQHAVAVIEDDEDTRSVIGMHLERAGYRVAPYESAAEAFQDMQAGAVPDVILLDLVLPGMNGWEFRIRQRGLPALSQVPVIILSGDSSPHARAIDAEAYLQKPVDFHRLSGVVANVLIDSKRDQLAHKAVEAERLRSLGMLVASVAHEVNNPLTYLMGNLDLLERKLPQMTVPSSTSSPEQLRLSAEVNEHVVAMRDGAERVAFIVRLLSTFARSNEEDVGEVDVLHAIDAATRLAQLQVRAKARLVSDLVPVPRVRANEARLAQVFLNLLVNASQAIPQGHADQNTVTIRTMATSTHAIVEVEDTGIGIAYHIRERIFEPFCTTKPAGVGTGLGLSISHEIVDALGGSLTFESVPGRTVFRVTLPASARNPEIQTGLAARPLPKTLRVLVIDDEPMIGRFVTAALPMCAVDTAVDPAVALDWLRERNYDLILCDLVMPAMSGYNFYEQLCTRRPDLKHTFVVATGSASDDALTHFLRVNAVTLLSKPFTVKELRQLAARVSLPTHET